MHSSACLLAPGEFQPAIKSYIICITYTAATSGVPSGLSHRVHKNLIWCIVLRHGPDYSHDYDYDYDYRPMITIMITITS